MLRKIKLYGKLAKFIDNDTGFIDVAMDSVNPKILYAASFQRRRFSDAVPDADDDRRGLWKRALASVMIVTIGRVAAVLNPPDFTPCENLN